MSDYRTMRVKFASLGQDRGKSKNRERNVGKFIETFQKPLEDVSITFAEYLKLKKTSGLKTDDGRPTEAAKKASDKLNHHKNIAGAFVAGHFEDGSRKKTALTFRSMICLDIDECTIEQAEAVKEGRVPISKYASFWYTTRSHTPEKPKLRLVIFLTEDVESQTKFEALTRWAATLLADDPVEGLEMADLVSFRWNQIMYMPSISVNQPYETGEIDGELLDPDAFLSGLPDWQDVSTWPVKQIEEGRRIGSSGEKREDPREKEGLIGAFCRVYDVEDAIAEWLTDIYTPSEDKWSRPRYHYVPGTGFNGAEVYDDGLFLHSHHGSDPIEGQANAWDLVRIHKFGHLDDDAHSNTSPGNMPSFKAMTKFVEKLPAVAAELEAARVAAFDDFDEDEQEDDDYAPECIKPDYAPERIDDSDLALDDLLGEPETDDLDDLLGDGDTVSKFDDEEKAEEPEKKKKDDLEWSVYLRKKKDGSLEPVQTNAALILMNDVRTGAAIGYNEWTMDPWCLKQIRSKVKAYPLPSEPIQKKDRKVGRKWDDSDDSAISLMLSASRSLAGYETDFSIRAIQDAVLQAGKKNRMHPVKQFLEGCHARWKGEGSPRGNAEMLAIRFLKCPDTHYYRQSALLFLVGAVARIMEPGCKFDQMAIIQGKTGSGKSLFWQILFNGMVTELKTKLDDPNKIVETLRGIWCCEMAEMDAVKKSDANTLKMMLSSQSDKTRLAYARRDVDFPRQSVFGGTSNDKDFLTDPTSNRRYWVWETPLDISNKIDNYGTPTSLLENLWAIWGEAYQVYLDMRAAQPTGILNLDLDDEARVEQEQIADCNRKLTPTEVVADWLRTWLESPVQSEDVEMHDGSSWEPENDTGFFLRNTVSPDMILRAMAQSPTMSVYRNFSVTGIGNAMRLIEGWENIGQKWRNKIKTSWYVREADAENKNAPYAIPFEVDEDNLDDLL